MPEPRPRRVLRDHGRHLRKREDEDEIEKELQRRDPVLALDGLLAHEPRLGHAERRPARLHKLAAVVELRDARDLEKAILHELHDVALRVLKLPRKLQDGMREHVHVSMWVDNVGCQLKHEPHGGIV